MIEIRNDPFSDSKVIYSPDRENRPDFTGYTKVIELSPENCPFCMGNEEMTPPEICSVKGDDDGWDIRVIPNKFPVLGIEGQYRTMTDSCYTMSEGVGAHEIIIETPSHSEVISNQSSTYFEKILGIYRDRIKDLKKDKRIKYIQVFKNHKAPAGATISHHHSQLIALPFVPGKVKNRLDILEEYFEKNQSTLFEDIIIGEQKFKKRIIMENSGFLVVAPYYSRSPFQVSIYQKRGDPFFENITTLKLKELSDVFRTIMKKIMVSLGDPPYNFILHNAPFDKPDLSYFSWYIDLLPIVGGIGGFETATGNFINPVFPEKAAQILKSDNNTLT